MQYDGGMLARRWHSQGELKFWPGHAHHRHCAIPYLFSKTSMRENQTGSRQASFSCEVCILAGGRSLRMGRDKRRLRLGGASLLHHVKTTAQKLDLPLRIVRRDLVPRCGPLGGIFTALMSCSTEAVLFLSCDMPFVSTTLLEKLLVKSQDGTRPVFVEQNSTKGFPFLMRREDLSLVSRQISRKQYSLQVLAKACNARSLRLPRTQHHELFNINTPEDWRQARDLWRRLKD